MKNLHQNGRHFLQHHKLIWLANHLLETLKIVRLELINLSFHVESRHWFFIYSNSVSKGEYV
jgi:hypothetical protein